MALETPSISSSAYRSTPVSMTAPFINDGMYNLNHSLQVAAASPPINQPNPLKKEVVPMSTRRVVQVFIADPDENVPMEQSILYKGEQKMTDLTDQELFFEVDIKSILGSHNAVRVKTVNKKVKERTEYLEPAKIRELKMVVVTVAQF